MTRPLTVRRMATRLRLYRLCRLAATIKRKTTATRNNPARPGFAIMKVDGGAGKYLRAEASTC